MSITIRGLLVILITSVIETFNLNFGAEELVDAITGIGLIIGFLTAYYGRIRQGDITWYGKKL